MADCVFCRMVRGEIEPDKVYEDEALIAIRDINPQAPVHILVIPKRHIDTVNDLTESDAVLVGRLLAAAGRVAETEGVAESGYRVVLNCNADALQSVPHLHLHIMGGRRFGWPPG